MRFFRIPSRSKDKHGRRICRRGLLCGVLPRLAMAAAVCGVAGTQAFSNAAAPIPPVILHLRESVEALSDTLQLRDLLAATSDQLSPAMDASVGNTPLGLAPALGKTSVIRRADLEAYVQRMHPKGAFTWMGAPQCAVSRPGIEVAEPEVRRLLEDALRVFAENQGEIRVLALANYSPLMVPKLGAVTEVELVAPNANTRFGSAMVNVQYQDRSFLRRSLRFEWEWKRPVWICTQSRPAGVIQRDSFTRDVRNILGIPSEPFFNDPLPEDLILARPISKNDLLLRANIKTPIAVERGSIVSARVLSGALLVSVQALALENGSIGQTIRVQNPNSKKLMLGKVTHEHIVQIIP
ncbi:MAG: flagellar basal body P-ring formation protein FlgA [Verrucomicrobia bacterium]|nr:flagellar basal body P-ring formation protein FlgA [Verrucomicrobiota bacterium]